MTGYKPITKSIQETIYPNGTRIHTGETEDGDFQLHFYMDGILKIVKKCYHKNDALYQHDRYLNRYDNAGLKGVRLFEKPAKKRIGVYETTEFTPEGTFYPEKPRPLDKLIKVIETQVYVRKGKEVINYKNKVFWVHKNNVPMAIKTDADYIFNLKTDLVDTKNE
jgi:hypothetical protein